MARAILSQADVPEQVRDGNQVVPVIARRMAAVCQLHLVIPEIRRQDSVQNVRGRIDRVHQRARRVGLHAMNGREP